MEPFTSFRQILLLCLGCLLLAAPAHGEPLTPSDNVRLGIPEQSRIDWQVFYSTDEPSKAVQKIELAHLGGSRLLAKFTFNKAPNFLLADLRVSLTFPALPPSSKKPGEVWLRLALANYSLRSDDETAETGQARVVQRENKVWIAYESPLAPDRDTNPVRLSFQYKPFPNATAEKLSAPIFSQLAKGSAVLAPLPPQQSTLVLSDTYYRSISDKRSTDDERQFQAILGTAYESLEYKGLTFEDIEQIKRPFDSPRARPSLETNLSPASSGKAGHALEPITITVKEESGLSYPPTALKAGIPFPKGQLFDPSRLALHDSEGAIHPSTLSLRAKWPDGSVQWLALDFEDTFAADETKTYRLSTVTHPASQAGRAVTLKEDATSLKINTGAIKVEIDKTRFLPFKSVSLEKKGKKNGIPLPLAADGFELKAGQTVFSTARVAPRSLTIEEQHPTLVVVRVEGSYANTRGDLWMSYLARLTFRAGSPLVEVSFTHINDHLATEFSDFSSLQWKILKPQSVVSAQSAWQEKGALKLHSGSHLDLAQWDDRQATIGTDTVAGTVPGGFRVQYKGGQIGLAVEDFWQRYPKGVTADASGLTLKLLPPLPSANFGSDLPIHLNFPFVEGGFRTKWGMSFTERWTIDFSGEWSVEALSGLAQKRPLPILSPTWYKKTNVFGAMAAGNSPLLSEWDHYFATLFEAHEKRRERQREYGFLNYGDWFGERGRSWGNNEYDTAHAFFMQSLRTGNRDYFRSALASARHQADVDIIHAYPDPFYVGGNYIHGIAHTGTTSHRPRHGIWSQDYGGGAWGSNGHTWAEGMTQAWLLAQDHRSAEAALELGEHLRWAVAPNFKMNVPNPRYAGWAVRAAMALYRTFGDAEHLKTAEMISAKASDEQDPETGGWLYMLYGGPPGNSVYMHGIIIAGLSEYHRETGDSHALDVMKKAGEFVKRSWDQRGYWPYMVIADGSPHPKRDSEPSPGLNILLAEGLAYLGIQTGDQEALDIARSAAKSQLAAPVLTASGQKVGFGLRSGVTLFGYLEDVDESAKQKPDQDTVKPTTDNLSVELQETQPLP